MALPRVLAIHLGALGDFVLSWPALKLLAAGPPQRQVHILGRPAWADLLLPPEQVYSLESLPFARLFQPEAEPALSLWLRRFELAVVFARNPPKELLQHLKAALPLVWTIPTRPSPEELRHAGRMQVQALQAKGLLGPPLDWPLRYPAIPSPPILAPGSGGREKRLPPDLAAHLASLLAQTGIRPLGLLGPAEDAEYRGALWQALGDKIIWLEEPGFPELAGRLAGCPMYVGADSGVSHLAAALNRRCLVGFTASSPEVFAPPGALAVDFGKMAEQLKAWL